MAVVLPDSFSFSLTASSSFSFSASKGRGTCSSPSATVWHAISFPEEFVVFKYISLYFPSIFINSWCRPFSLSSPSCKKRIRSLRYARWNWTRGTSMRQSPLQQMPKVVTYSMGNSDDGPVAATLHELFENAGLASIRWSRFSVKFGQSIWLQRLTADPKP